MVGRLFKLQLFWVHIFFRLRGNNLQKRLPYVFRLDHEWDNRTVDLLAEWRKIPEHLPRNRKAKPTADN